MRAFIVVALKLHLSYHNLKENLFAGWSTYLQQTNE